MSVRPLLLCAPWLVACGGAEPLPTTGTESVETFPSAIVDDDYVLRVRLPPGVSAGDDAQLPLVVQLDPTFVGLQQYAITAGLVSAGEAAGDWSDTVVVGIDYVDAFAGRERDYRPPDPPDEAFDGEGADRFHRVLRDEVLPHLEATLPVDPDRRVLVGHSNGAVFAWYEALRHEDGVAPLFAGMVAADAGIDESLFTYERWHAERATDLPLRLYASRAFFNGAGQAVTFEGLVDRLADRGFPSLALQTAELHTDHGGAVAPSFEDGLSFTLGGLP